MKDQIFLLQTLSLAQKYKGFTCPNPAVGAVLVKSQKIIGEGSHEGSGKPHAEVLAIQSATEDPTDSTLYVSLEPCCHFGKTPPCTELILKSKIKRVVYAHRDPNPIVNGKGEFFLKDNNISCEYIPTIEAKTFYRSYDHWTLTKKPYVTAKIALTSDSKIAHADGTPLKITGPEADQNTHEERKKTSAILTTAKTLIADNPKLNVRLNNHQFGKPLFILDRHLKTPLSSQALSLSSMITFLVSNPLSVLKESEAKSQGFNVIRFPEQNSLLSWDEIFSEIGKFGFHDLWVEAGGSTFESLITQKKLNRAILYQSSLVLGDRGLQAFKSLDLQALKLRSKGSQKFLGRDIFYEIVW